MENRQIEAAVWYKQLKDSNNDTFLPLFFDEHRYLVLRGGGGSGKSIFAGRKVLERVTTEENHRFLVCRKVARTLRESCFEQLRGQLAAYYPKSGYKVNKSDMVISFPNGGKIIFAGLDDVEKLKSIYNVTGIWIEEASELEEGDFNQLDIRLRGETKYYKQIILTFNPISIKHWLKKRFWDTKDPRARTHESTYKDNRFLDAENIRTLEAFKDTDPYYYMVYALNQWGVLGKTVFDRMAISQRLEQLRPPVAEGFFAYTDTGHSLEDIHWVEEKGGPVCIYHHPEAGRPYVIGGDTAGDGSDWFVGQVLDNITCRQMAKLRHRTDEDVYARQMYCLGKYYNTALIGIETNFSTYPVKELSRLGYPKQYVREREDSFDGNVRHAYGVRTDGVTRPVMLAGLIHDLRGHYDALEDEETLGELLTFVRNDKLRMEAEAGAHDDCVMALAIAHYIRPQQRMQPDVQQIQQTKWTRDMREDYRRASPDERAWLLQKWGKPEP